MNYTAIATAVILVAAAWSLVAGVALEYRRALRMRRAYLNGLQRL